ncbi:DNA glycosylase AlkZ-like family protein [Catenuloplanes japonicus]|uniref:DNA glycosylase AlkZ-like family protein n=1 Tax=Catenuloplanes japonicus TaxID=33876 RepID=UPI0005256EEA|nr:crosslink repair DNA glycosylase YcaQ family protein [Catenuloplanes japonicus]
MIELSPVEARRLAVRAQLLDADGAPAELLEVVRHLTRVQHDPTAAVAPSADLVLWARLGADYHPRDLRDALDEQRLLELDNMIHPAGDLALYQAEMAVWPGRPPLTEWQEDLRDWVDANDGCRRDIIARLRGDGPLTVRELPDTCVVPWRSSGWTNDRNVRKLVDLMVARGEVAAAGRRGTQRLWDLADRIYPDDPVPYDEAMRARATRRLRALGITRPSPGEEPVGELATVDGVRGRWRVDPALLDAGFTGRTALLSPLDRLVFDRRRLTDLFGYDYQLEMYKPAAKRRWGYWAMPILSGDRLIGKLDATADRRAGVLRVDAIHEDAPFTPAESDAVRAEIDALAEWLGLDPVEAAPGADR